MMKRRANSGSAATGEMNESRLIEPAQLVLTEVAR